MADFLKEVAAEHSKGRRLLIGTTNLDAQRPVIWDMGQIASSGHPGAHRTLPQSSARFGCNPGRFPAGLRRGRGEWHRLRGNACRWRRHARGFPAADPDSWPEPRFEPGINPIRRTYIIRNGRVEPEWKAVKARTLSIAGRSISTLIKNQGIGDLYEMYRLRQAKRHGLQPHLHSDQFSRHQHPSLRSRSI